MAVGDFLGLILVELALNSIMVFFKLVFGKGVRFNLQISAMLLTLSAIAFAVESALARGQRTTARAIPLKYM